MENIDKIDNSLNSKKNENRIDEIDIIKALAIICMVAGHSGAPFSKFIYLFHMAVFFIASGFFYKDSSSDSAKNVIRTLVKKLKLLWLPYFVWNMFFNLLNNFFIKINVYTDNPELLNYVSGQNVRTHAYMSITEIIQNIIKGVLFGGGSELGGAFWFLKILFMISVCYCFVDFLAKYFINKALIVQFISSAILLTFGYWCSINGYSIHGIAQASSFYCLYFIGHCLSIIKTKYQYWKCKQFLAIFLISFTVLHILNQFGEISLSQNRYVNPAYLLTTSFMGWCFLYSISYFVVLLPIKNFFLEIGKRTLTIVIFHFLAFKLVGVIVVRVYELPDFCIAAFPNLYGSTGMWWLAYTIVGVGIPIVLNIIYNFLVNKLTLKKAKRNHV